MSRHRNRIAAIQGNICVCLLLLCGFATKIAYTAEPKPQSLHTSRQKRLNRQLIAAIRRNNAQEVERLLARGADPNARDYPPSPRRNHSTMETSGTTPTALLVALGARTNEEGSIEIVPENLAILKSLVKTGARLEARDAFGRSPLLLAVAQDSRASVQLLLDCKANINARNHNGETALILAAREDNPDLIQLLLAHHANAALRDAQNRSSYDYVNGLTMEAPWPEIRQRLKQAGAKSWAAFLLEHSVRPVPRAAATSALFAAISHQDEEEARAALDAGADPNAREALNPFEPDAEERAPALLALLYPHHEPNLNSLYPPAENARLVKALLERGADSNAVDNQGLTPLILAAAAGLDKTVQLLLEHGAKVNARSSFVESSEFSALTPLLVSANGFGNEYENIVQLLLAGGADVNAADANGETALMKAVEYGRENILKMLIAAHADIQQRDKAGKTALRYAKAQPNPRIAPLLEQTGAKE